MRISEPGDRRTAPKLAPRPGVPEGGPNGRTAMIPEIADPVNPAPANNAPSATRNDLQIGRRLFHLLNGVATATGYALLFTHE